jgi:hypothetical protein
LSKLIKQSLQSAFAPWSLSGCHIGICVDFSRADIGGEDVGSIKHVSEDLFGVLKSFSHLGVSAIKGCCEWILTSFTFQVDVGHQFLLA